jgi:hypothetical protein
LGINSQWISTKENTTADDMSRLEPILDDHSHSSFDYLSFLQSHPELKDCFFFHPKPELILLIRVMVLTQSWPGHDKIVTLKQQPLGRLTTFCGAK